MRTSNPALNPKVFDNYGSASMTGQSIMTIQGTINKIGMLLLLAFLAAAWSWILYLRGASASTMNLITFGGAIGGFIAALVTIFKKEWSPVSAPVYALLEGLLLGGISVVFNNSYPGIAFQAVFLTFATLLTMLFIYKTGIIKVTEKFRLGVFAATGGIALFYFISIILGFFGVNVPYVFGNGIIGIGFSLLVVGIAALNLVLDFDFIESGAENGAPKYMEWYAAFGLMVTLIWLYLEILRLLAKSRSRR